MSSSRFLQGLTVTAFVLGIGLHHSADAAPQTSSTFTPMQIPNLQAWFDPSQTGGVGGGAGVNFLKDWSGNNNGLYQANTAKQPVFTNGGINKLGSLIFDGKNDLVGLNTSFSKNLFNESSVFIVSNQSNATQASSLLWTGPYKNNPRWDLRLSESGNTHFDFDNSAGRVSYKNDPVGPSLWTAEASVSAKTQILHKNGNAVASGRPYGSTVAGNFPVELGGTDDGTALSYQYSGLIGEVLVYNRALSASETAEAEGYLACKWGLQSQLPAGHPYRTVCPQGTVPQPTPTPAPTATPVSNALIDPPHLVSANGSLTFNVTASQAANGRPQFVYNGSTAMPTLELSPGDTLYVNLTNNLPKPASNAGYLNDTSLHYHGLHVSPNAPADDSIDMIAMPGQALHYKIAIPTSHPSGLYWYHSHAHGEAERQNLAGMSGALIIDGIEKSVPAVASLPTRILIARDTVVPGEALPLADKNQVRAMFWAMSHGTRMSAISGMAGMSMDTPVRGSTNAKTRNPYVDTNPKYKTVVRSAADSHCVAASPEAPSRDWTMNGQTTPAIGIKPGEKQFWRLVNAGSDTYLDVQVDNTTMQIVGLDGVPLASVGNKAMTVGHYLLPPASRMEFIVTGPAAGTTAYLRTNCFDAGASGLAMPATILAKIDPSHSVTTIASKLVRAKIRGNGGGVSGKLHAVAYIKAFVKANGIARKQTLTYSDQDQINGQSYDPSGPAQFYAQSGTMEQWQIVNVSDQVHTFHIHQTHFLVDSIVGGTAIEQSNVGQELDNINVPAANANGPGSVTLTMDFTDPSIIGTFLLHCHILSHEDMGMMSKIRVGTAPPLTTNAPADGISFTSPSAPSQTVTVAGGTKPYSLSGCSGVATASVSGSVVTLKPSGSGACVLVVADTSGLTANVAVTVAAAASLVTVSPKSLAFSTPTSASQNATISGGKPPYAVSSACGSIASASVGNATLTVVPHAAGSCALVVSDASKNTYSVSITVNAVSTSNASDVATFHNNNARQGWNQSETVLTAANVNANSFGELKFLTGTGYGKVYAQPLFASNESINGTKHNLVLVATATDQVYAYDDKTYALVWHRSFTNASAGITQQIWSDLGSCKDVNPDIGITGTPVIDRSLDRMYVVVPTKENGTFHQRLHAISLQNGNDAVGPVEVSASEELAGNQGVVSTNPQHNFNRTALLEANGAIYVGFGSHCDGFQNITHGWLLAYNTSTLAPAGTVFNAVDAVSSTGNYLGSLWMSGYGPAADSSGNIYFATGNGPWNGVSSFGMSDLKLPGNLNIANGSYFTVYNQAALSSTDQDLGAGGIMLLPGGKTQTKYLLNRDNMGGYKSGDSGAVWQGYIPGGFNGQSFFQDASGNSYIVGGTGNIGTYLFNPASATLALKNSASTPGSCMECRNGGSQSIISSNGTNAGTTIVWTLHTGGSAGGTIALYAYDASTMKFLYTGDAGDWLPGSNAGGAVGAAFISPMEANGKVYVPTDGGVAVFGLK
jgi:suppressor of ftsI